MTQRTVGKVNVYAKRFESAWARTFGEEVACEVTVPVPGVLRVRLANPDGTAPYSSCATSSRDAIQQILGAEAVLREIEQRILVGELRKGC